MIRFLKNGKGSSIMNLNIFVQNNEPEIKKGLWLKKSDIYTNVIEDEHVYASEEWNTDKMSELAVIPYNFSESQGAVAIGTDVYLFGGVASTTAAYKYNTLTDAYTQLTSTNYAYTNKPAAVIGTDVYLLGENTDRVYRYDTLTDTYTQLRSVPYTPLMGAAVAIGTNIFIFGGGDSDTKRKYTYKYDSLTNTYTKLGNAPIPFSYHSVVSIGTDVYIFGNADSNYNTRAYKYDTLTDTYTQLANMPNSYYYGSAVAVGSMVYIFGGDLSNTTALKYNVLTNTYTQISNIPYDFWRGVAVLVNNEIYLFGGGGYPTKVGVMELQPKTYPNNSIVIANNKTKRYETVLIDTDVTNGLKYYFDNFWQATTENNVTTFDVTSPAYYGNGTNWVKIRN